MRRIGLGVGRPGEFLCALLLNLLLAPSLHAEELACPDADTVAMEVSAPLLELAETRSGSDARLCVRGENLSGDVRLAAHAVAAPLVAPLASHARVEVIGIAHANGARIEIPGPRFVPAPGPVLPPSGAFGDHASSVSIGRHLGDGEVYVFDRAAGSSTADSRADASNQGNADAIAESQAGALHGAARSIARASSRGLARSNAFASSLASDAHAVAEARGSASFASATASGELAFFVPRTFNFPPALDPRQVTASAHANASAHVAAEARLSRGGLSSQAHEADAFIAAAAAPGAAALAPFLSNANVAGAFQGIDEVLAAAHVSFASGAAEAGPITLSARLGIGETFYETPLATPFSGVRIGFVGSNIGEGAPTSLRIRIGWVGRLVFDQTFATSDGLAMFLDCGVVHVAPTDGPLDFGVLLPTFGGGIETLSIWIDATFDSPDRGLDFGVIVGANQVPEPALAVLLALGLAALLVLRSRARATRARSAPARACATASPRARRGPRWR